MKKKLDDFFSISMVVMILIVVFGYYLSNLLDIKYHTQNLNVDKNQFTKSWGKPDDISADGLIWFYKSKNFTGDRYVFIFDEKTNKLKAKHYDD